MNISNIMQVKIQMMKVINSSPEVVNSLDIGYITLTAQFDVAVEILVR